MYKIICFCLLLMIVGSILFLDRVDASDNVTLITNVVGDNATIHLITNVIDDHHSQAYWWGCCGDGWGERNSISRSIPLNFLNIFPNMMTGIVNPESVCGDIRADILRVEPSSVTVGSSIDMVFVAESNCHYVGNISLLVDGKDKQTLGIDLTGEFNRTYRTTLSTVGLSSGAHTVSVLGGQSTFNVANVVIPTVIESPKAVEAQKTVEKTEDKIIMWVAIAIGGIILVTLILLIILR